MREEEKQEGKKENERQGKKEKKLISDSKLTVSLRATVSDCFAPHDE